MLCLAAEDNAVENKEYVERLAHAYPAQFKAQVNRVSPVSPTSEAEEILNELEKATDTPMGKAMMLALLLDEHFSGQNANDASTRAQAAQLFEEKFSELDIEHNPKK